MNPTLVMKQTAGQCKFSPNGRFFAAASDRNRLIVRSTSDLDTVQIFVCSDTISLIEWSKDSEYIFCAMFKSAVVQVFSLSDPDKYSCRIKEGVAGLIHCTWAPDSRQLLTVADFQLHITVWNLNDKSQHCIKNPKLGASGISFSSDDRFVAVVHRKECKDHIGIYAVHADWQRVKYFTVASTDLEELTWSPKDDCIVVRDCSIEYLVLVYSPTGNIIARYQPYDRALGVKALSFSPNGNSFAVGSYDQSCRILNTLTWKCALECIHNPSTVPTRIKAEGAKENKRTDENNDSPRTVRVIKPDLTKLTPRIGVGALSWSSESEFVATRNDSMPYTLWIWSPTSVKPVAVLEFETRVCSFKWDPARPRLAIAIGTRSIAFWSKENGLSMLKVENNEWQEVTRGIRWNSTGNQLILVAKQKFLNVTV